jgi:hypothetical protein
MVREYKHRDVVRRLLTPPAAPRLVRPRAADGPEHVPSQDPRADPDEPPFRHPVVDTRVPAGLSVHLTPGPGAEEPLHELRASHAQRVLQVLSWPGADTVR